MKPQLMIGQRYEDAVTAVVCLHGVRTMLQQPHHALFVSLLCRYTCNTIITKPFLILSSTNLSICIKLFYY